MSSILRRSCACCSRRSRCAAQRRASRSSLASTAYEWPSLSAALDW
eukprot:CAMPEP_0196794040 /NCGR_PEP_ID=MMETSP1104-20130614/33868_1 /TAXON_ID=33652 /ORGANISM="Cafeteria sp., Strain Caron Lab Isolate" /LENGTH=45 /DNA_ID= /DNA_START= /DNA_END= /DNA_ORIENTATION=